MWTDEELREKALEAALEINLAGPVDRLLMDAADIYRWLKSGELPKEEATS